ncbi:hypothetical protein PoB_006365500 [Plakobranchus ocellatus]|uniref:Uncharacterized protein n=1 Tax=Plakobranchus ocellatus TaxID=259542 RepID=A0AAV4CZ45_9GAST|nr:hypothetical protein PoB_006365500 [Plakobranchus ocellatus]
MKENNCKKGWEGCSKEGKKLAKWLKNSPTRKAQISSIIWTLGTVASWASVKRSGNWEQRHHWTPGKYLGIGNSGIIGFLANDLEIRNSGIIGLLANDLEIGNSGIIRLPANDLVLGTVASLDFRQMIWVL